MAGAQRMQAQAHTSEEDRARSEAKFKERLKEMDAKLKDLRKKERGFAQVERLKARTEETCCRLQSDIHGLKQQKVRERKKKVMTETAPESGPGSPDS